jgi:HTH-type transcriptional regulator, sugar sensing transcriptional regulator
MDTVKVELKKLGLTEKQITIYLTLLSSESASVRTLSSLSKINRGTTYNILKSLSDLGLVSQLTDDGTKSFVVNDPNSIHSLLNDKQDSLNDLREDVGNIVQQLGSIYSNHGNKPLARYYEGIDGAELILRDVLNSVEKTKDKEYFVYSHHKIKNNLYDKFKDFSKERIARKINVKAISFTRDVGALSGMDQRRYFKTTDEQLTYILIYAGKTAFIARNNSRKLSGVVLENEHIYSTHKAIFLNLWKTLPPLK